MKKTIFLYIQAGLFLLLVVSCRKDLLPEATAGVTIVNAVSGSDNLVANFTTNYSVVGNNPVGMYVRYRTYAPSHHLTIQVRKQPVLIYKAPAVAGQHKPFYELELNPVAGEASTLFLAGSLEQPEAVLVTKLPPYYTAADSILGLRFINLAPDKMPVRIRISGKGTDLAVSNLAYKSVTEYLPVKADASVSDVKVEFFGQVSGVLLKSYTLKDAGATNLEKNKWRYRNYTMVWLPYDANGTLAEDPFLIDDF